MVKRWIKMILAATLAGVLMLGTSGCGIGFTLSPEDLYRLPQLPAEYTELDKQLSALISAGAEYAPPSSGAKMCIRDRARVCKTLIPRFKSGCHLHIGASVLTLAPFFLKCSVLYDRRCLRRCIP